MNWRKAKPVACAMCGVLFAARRHDAFPELCLPHKVEVHALKVRKDAVAAWAAQHWEILEPLSKIARMQTITIGGSGGGGGGSGTGNYAAWASQL